MTTRVISEWYVSQGLGKAVVKYSSKDELFYINYHDENGLKFFTEEFPNRTLQYVEEAAENWTFGIKKLETL